MEVDDFLNKITNLNCYDRSLAPDKRRAPHTGQGSDSLVLIEAGASVRSFYGILLYVAEQNFKISTSEYLRYASKRAISRLNNQKFSGKPEPSPLRGGEHPLPSPHPPRRLRRLAPSAPRCPPQTKILPTPLFQGCNDYLILPHLM